MHRIIHIIRKEFLQIFRDRKMLPIIFVLPVAQLIVLGYAANLDVKNIPTVICDMDYSTLSRGLVDKFTNSGYFQLVGYVDKIDDVDGYINNGSASVALVIPRDFADKLKRGGSPVQLQLLADGSDANLATSGLSYASAIVADFSTDRSFLSSDAIALTMTGIPRIDAETRIWYNPELKSSNFMVPGILGLLLMLTTMLLTSLAIVKEKEIGTMEQLIVTPIKPWQLIIGKLAPFAVIGLIDVLLILFVAVFWFNIPIKGSPLLLIVLCFIFLLTTLGLGLFVSTVSRTQQQAMITAVFFVMQPMIFLSGFVFPIENMPKIIQLYTYLLPLRYFFIIVRGIFLKGAGLAELWHQALIMFLFGVAILTLSASRFRKKLG